MYIFSFNINKKIGNETTVLTEIPTILTNDNLNEIIFQIRTLILSHFSNISLNYKIPLSNMILGISVVYKENETIFLHKFNINLSNIRETKEILKTIKENE